MKTNTNTNILKEFGKSIIEFRKKIRCSQLAFAESIEMDQKSLRQIEKGISDPRYDVVVKIFTAIKSKYQNITFEELLRI